MAEAERRTSLVGLVRGARVEAGDTAGADNAGSALRTGGARVLGRYAELEQGGTWAVWMCGDAIRIEHGDETRFHLVPNYGTWFGDFIARETLRVSLARFPGGERVLYIYDPADDCFGYAWNLDWVDGSEWGYAPMECV